MLRRLSFAGSALVLTLSGCSAAPTTQIADSGAPTPPSAGVTAKPPAPAPPDPSPVPKGDTSRTVRCDNLIASEKELPPGFPPILDSVAFQREIEFRRPQANPPDPWSFHKSGLPVRIGARVELRVPPEQKSRLRIKWGNPPAPSSEPGGLIVVDGCASPDPAAEWIVFAGGYEVRGPGCYPLDVTAGGRTERVRVAIGARCPA
ncbi:hypothetical protein [Rhizohabitans arisaemae]|uniref:hypothetical protein n=1 Tax=Rhizohabitans arisaemae TaxID=2720610 RepID=UPI0024B22444|nr:hypothetical protein [Rhizohabitans arisaemae]